MKNTNDVMVVVEFVNRNLQVLVGVAFLAVIGCVGTHYGLRYRSMANAERLASKGYGLLAQEVLEPYRKDLASSERGCKVMLNTYFETQDVRNLEYASQSCLNHGKDIPEVYLAMASARELAGKDGDAIQILGSVLKRFDKVAEIPMKMGQILQRNKNDKDALAAYSIASERAPQDYRLALNILQYAMQQNFPNEVKAVVERLKKAPTDNAEVKFILARAFTMIGDGLSAKVAVDQGKELMNKTPASKPDLEKKYADLLNPGAVTTAKAPGKQHRKISSSKVD